MLSRSEAKAITDRVLSQSKADEVQVTLSGGSTSNLRFARNAPSTSGSSSDVELTIASTFGARTGTVTVNQIDWSTIDDAVRRCEEIAQRVPEDPEHVPVLGAQEYASVDGFSQETADKGTERMVDGVAGCLRDAIGAGLVAAGFTEAAARYSCIASSRGLFGYHRSTSAYMAETVRTPDGTGSGWASASSHRIADIDYGLISGTAMSKARASVQPRPIDPGPYETILEPACVANLMSMMLFGMNARRADEGRSYFSAGKGKNRRGEALFPQNINLYSDPLEPGLPGAPWDNSGVPQKRRHWIKDGVVENLITDRFWAQKNNLEPVPFPSNVIMAGGRGTVDDLIASTKRGVLVTSLWYIRGVDPRTMLFTGITRDGVFWIEDGKIAYPVSNLRWNDSPISVLKNIEAMSAPVRVPPRPTSFSTFMYPALKLKQFHFTSVSDAV